MDKKFLVRKIICGAMIGCIAITMGGVALATDLEGEATTDSEATGVKRTRMLYQAKDKTEFGQLKGFMVKSKAPGKGLEAVLDKLVENGGISQEKADEIKEYLQTKAESRKADFEKIKSMTKEERQKYMEENKDRKKERFNIMEQLVLDNVITEVEREQIESKLKEIMPQRENAVKLEGFKNRIKPIKNGLLNRPFELKLDKKLLPTE